MEAYGEDSEGRAARRRVERSSGDASSFASFGSAASGRGLGFRRWFRVASRRRRGDYRGSPGREPGDRVPRGQDGGFLRAAVAAGRRRRATRSRRIVSQGPEAPRGGSKTGASTRQLGVARGREGAHGPTDGRGPSRAARCDDKRHTRRPRRVDVRVHRGDAGHASAESRDEVGGVSHGELGGGVLVDGHGGRRLGPERARPEGGVCEASLRAGRDARRREGETRRGVVQRFIVFRRRRRRRRRVSVWIARGIAEHVAEGFQSETARRGRVRPARRRRRLEESVRGGPSPSGLLYPYR